MKTVLRFFLLFLFIGASSPLIHGKDIKICLSLVIKDDAESIVPCIDSVQDIIDCICICDIGSTDTTLSKVKTFIESRNIRGKICKIKDKGISQNRSTSIACAQQAIKQWNFPLETTYLLCMESTHTASIKKEFDKSTLNADAYLSLQKTPLLCHYYPHLLKASMPWKFMGTAFGQWTCQTAKMQREDSIAFEDHRAYDEAFLNEKIQLAKNDQNLFYIGLCYKQLHNYEEAITWFKATIAKEESRENVWYSKFILGVCHEQLGQDKEALQAYLDAYNYNPERAEPLRTLATYYRYRGQNDLAYKYAKQGVDLPYPKDAIYVVPEIYHYQFDEELTIATFYTPQREEGFNAAHRLILKRDVPYNVKYQTYQNILYYLQPLKNAHYKPIQFTLPFIREGSLRCFNPMNPSILKTDEGYEVICRVVNYEQFGATHFPFIDPEIPNQIIIARNYLLHYDKNYKLVSQKEIFENIDRKRYPRGTIQGLEDCRIFAFEKGFWFTCTTLDTSPTWQPQISLCKLENPSLLKENVQVEKLVPLKGPNPFRCEKNWLPFVSNDTLHIIYSFDPFIVYRPDTETGECPTYLKYIPTHDFSHFRGSAGPMPFEEGYLVLVHEVVCKEYRNYIHRFLYLDKDLVVQKASKPFMFNHLGVEYCCSMTQDHSGDNIVMAIGMEDREVYLCTLDKDSIHSILEPLP